MILELRNTVNHCQSIKDTESGQFIIQYVPAKQYKTEIVVSCHDKMAVANTDTSEHCVLKLHYA